MTNSVLLFYLDRYIIKLETKVESLERGTCRDAAASRGHGE